MTTPTPKTRRTALDKAVERIVIKYWKLDTALSRASEKNANDYRVARDATLDVLILVIAGDLTDHGMPEAEARLAARETATELLAPVSGNGQ